LQRCSAFKEYLAEGDLGRFLGFWSTMVTATFAYLGTELVGVTVGEAQNPRKTIPRAIKLTFFRILFFYCLSVLLIGTLVPYDSPDLLFANKNGRGANASPFVVAIKLSKIPALPDILNACILLFVFSASNSDLYIASRTLYGLASDGDAPAIFKRTDSRGVPIYALGLSSFCALLAYLNVAQDSTKVFGYLVNVVTIFGLLTWISILVTHIWFVRARKAQGLTDGEMPYVSPAGLYGSVGALAMCILVSLTKNFDVFVGGDFGNEKYKNFITGYIGIPVYLVMLFTHKLVLKTKGVKPLECDFYTGKDIIDAEENAFLAKKAEKLATRGDLARKGGWFYRTFVAWLF
jgi:yeast amino acid transporter